MNDQELIQTLTHEAAGGPAFSPDLHRRIMARIDAEGIEDESIDADRAAASSRPPTASRGFWQLPAILTAAAAVVIAVGIARFVRRPAGPPAAHPDMALRLPVAPAITNPVQSLQTPAVRDWANTECAGVNRDAGNVVAYVQRQFEMLPTVR